MNYEQKYKDALERAKKWHNAPNADKIPTLSTRIIEEIFPDLKESEDERMVKFIKKQLFNIKKTITENYELDAKLTKAIDWLEKQGNLMKALQISNAEIGELVEKNYYLKEQLEKQGKNNMGILEATKKKLEDNLNKALEKETPESCNEFLEKQGSKKENLKERNICDTCEDSNGCLIPCCAKLLEKQGEQKMKTPEESLGIDSDTYNKIVDECVYGEQKPAAWSEEDEKMLNDILMCGEHHCYLDTGNITWLKSIKDRVQPQQKQEWSEEDSPYYDDICEILINLLRSETANVNKTAVQKDLDWLNSLKPHNTWKPSDEQMLAINTAINVLGKGTINGKYLIELHEQLKKLREE